MLLSEALRLGTDLRLDQHVKSISCEGDRPCAILENGQSIHGDVIVGGDGMYEHIRRTAKVLLAFSGLSSVVRPAILGPKSVSPRDSGDMAFRATILPQHIRGLSDSARAMFDPQIMRTWWGPDSHVVFYPIRQGKIWNLVMIAPDDLPPDIPRAEADIEDMKSKFVGWDPILRTLVANVQKCDKWKVRIMDELPTWVKGSATLLGDACHPTLPYQAQGAAMAVEDGAVLGKLFGLRQKHAKDMPMGELLKLYEALRKDRTTINVQGAQENRRLYHMRPEDVIRLRRNEQLKELDINDPQSTFPWSWGRLSYLKDLLGFDVVADAEQAFWKSCDHEKKEVSRI